MDEKSLVSPFLTVSDLASRWKKPSQWIYANWREIGLKPVAIGQQLRFRLDDIANWELDNQVTGRALPEVVSRKVAGK